MFVVTREKARRHNTEEPCQSGLLPVPPSVCVTLLSGSSGWTTDLSNLLFCSVQLFTAIEGKRNALGKVFRIHRGETVGFP